MIKYNYKKAAALWDQYYNLCVDPWTLGDVERQRERRAFMRAVTRHIDIKLYIDYIYELIDEARPAEGIKSRCFDFERENALEDLISDIKLFYRRQTYGAD